MGLVPAARRREASRQARVAAGKALFAARFGSPSWHDVSSPDRVEPVATGSDGPFRANSNRRLRWLAVALRGPIRRVRQRRQRAPAASLPRQPASSSSSFSRLPLGLLSLQHDDRCGALERSDSLPRSLTSHFAIAPFVQIGSLPGRVSSCPLVRPVPLWPCMAATAAAGEFFRRAAA